MVLLAGIRLNGKLWTCLRTGSVTITLEQVRKSIIAGLGADAFVAGFIKQVRADDAVETAAINKDGVMTYSESFVTKNIKSSESLFCLIFHELLHSAFRHFIRKSDVVTNLACDAVINACISLMYSKESGSGELFRHMYPLTGLSSILRPGSGAGTSVFGAIYGRLYSPPIMTKDRVTAGELITALRLLLEATNMLVIAGNVPLLGSHGSDGNDTGEANEIASRIAHDFEAAIASGKMAGSGEVLTSLLIKVLKSKTTLQTYLLSQYASRRIYNAFVSDGLTYRRTTSPFPLAPSRRDIVMLGAGIWPGIFHNDSTVRCNIPTGGLYVYLDVSGSVESDLPSIVGLLDTLKHRLSAVYTFSTRVVETSMNDLRQGRIRTSYGTDFDCIAQQIEKDHMDRVIIFTDGEATMTDRYQAMLKANQVKILTVLFTTSVNYGTVLRNVGDVVSLADILA